MSGFKRHSRGFSLIEVLVAVLLLAIGALAAVTIQRSSAKANQASSNREIAGALARQLLERVERMPYPISGGTYNGCLNDTGTSYVDPCAAVSPEGNPLSKDGTNDPIRGIFTRRWRVTLNPSPTPSGGAAAHQQNYATVRVRVSWNQAGENERVEIATVKGWTR